MRYLYAILIDRFVAASFLLVTILAIGLFGVSLPKEGLAANVASPDFHFLAADASLRAVIQNATPIMGQATFVGKVLKKDQPWEANYLYNYPGSVVIDPTTGQWRMYYELKTASSQQCTALAVSDDGVHWTKPALNISGTKYTTDPNNSFINNTSATWIGGPQVFIDPNAPANQRYRMSEHADVVDGALYASASADGLNWRRVGVIDNAGGPVMDSQNTAFWDPKTNQYISYMRYWYSSSGRGVFTKRSDTFDTNWTGAREFTIDCGNIPQIAASSVKADMYCSSVIPYKGQYIGLPSMYYHPATQADGPVYPTFMYSRDSSNWSFEDPYQPIIDLSAHGDFQPDRLDFGQAYMMTTVQEKDGWLYLYYGWYPEQHNTFPQSSSITYLAKLREDRFVGIQAEGSDGIWTTSAITLSDEPGHQLIINAMIDGSVRVEVLDSTTRQPLTGFSEANGLSIGPGDYLNAIAKWNGYDDLNALAGQEVVLRFLMNDATIYSFRFAAVPEPSPLMLLFCGGVCWLFPRRRSSAMRNNNTHCRCLSYAGTLGLACVTLVGCGKESAGKPLHGSVICNGEKASMGQVYFVPTEGNTAPICTAPIVDGEYRIAAPGGVPLGKYRVQVDARKTTGRKVQGNNGREVTMIDETARLGPETYAGEQSPLVVDIRPESDATFDITLR